MDSIGHSSYEHAEGNAAPAGADTTSITATANSPVTSDLSVALQTFDATNTSSVTLTVVLVASSNLSCSFSSRLFKVTKRGATR